MHALWCNALQVRLLISAECPPADIFVPGDGKRALDHDSRTCGALMRMEMCHVSHGRLMDDLAGVHPSSVTSALFTGEEEIFAFRRTVSRLLEIQTAEYWRVAGPAART